MQYVIEIGSIVIFKIHKIDSVETFKVRWGIFMICVYNISSEI